MQGRLDIGELESGFVVAHCGASRSVIYGSAFDTRDLANPLFHFGHAQRRQHVAHFNNARSHRDSLVVFIFIQGIRIYDVSPPSFAAELPRDSIECAEHKTSDGEQRESRQESEGSSTVTARLHYNPVRPHSSLSCMPPAPEAVLWPALQPGPALPANPDGSACCYEDRQTRLTQINNVVRETGFAS